MTLPVVTVNGSAFQADGQPWHYVGLDAFSLFKRWLMRDGQNALVRPWVQEQISIAHAGGYQGPIVYRVFRFAAPPNAFALDPWSYDFAEVTAFTNFIGDLGGYVHWTCGDAQIVLPNPEGPRGQQQHLNEFCNALVLCSNAFVQTCNEPFKNGIDVTTVIPPRWGSYLRDSGAYGATAADYNPVLDIATYHPSRDTGGLSPFPKWLIDLNDSLATMTNWFQRPCVLDEPIGFAETESAGKRCASPDCAFLMGQTVAYGGITFHFDAGMSCDSPGPVQRACEEAFFAGAKGAIR